MENVLRSLVVTVFQATTKTPAKGVGIKCAADLAVREKTQSLTPIQASITIHNSCADMPNGKGINNSNIAIAKYFRSCEWADKQWHSDRYISATKTLHKYFVEDEQNFQAIRLLHLAHGREALNDSV